MKKIIKKLDEMATNKDKKYNRNQILAIDEATVLLTLHDVESARNLLKRNEVEVCF